MSELPAMMLTVLNPSRIKTKTKDQIVPSASSKMEVSVPSITPKLSRVESELLKCLDKEHSDEQVLKHYACSWQKDSSYIPFQGHLYITANFICFYSSFLGWETKVAVRCRDIVALSKQKMAFVIPNAITISTTDKKYTLTSFMSRNHAYRAIQCVWQNSLKRHPLSSAELLKVLKGPGRNGRTLRRTSSEGSSKLEDSEMTTESSEPESVPDNPLHEPIFNIPSVTHHSGNHAVIQSHSDTGFSSLSESLPVSHRDYGDSSSHTSFSEGRNESLSQEDLLALSFASEGPDGTSNCSSSERQLPKVEGRPQSDREQGRIKMAEAVVGSSLDVQSKPLLLVPTLRQEADPSVLTDGCDDAEVDGVPLAALQVALDSRGSWQNLWIKCKQLLLRFPVALSSSSLFTIATILLISLFFLSSVTLLCELSMVDPTLQAWLGWQPWCAAGKGSHPPMLHPSTILTKSMFKEMVAKHHIQNPSLAPITSQEPVPVDSVLDPQASPSVHQTK